MSDVITVQPQRIDVQQPAPIAPKADKIRKPSRKLAEAIRLLVEGECKTRKDAAAAVGLNYTHLCEALKKPHVRVFVERACRETISTGTMMRATARLAELVDAGSEHVSADMSKHVLAIAGIKPTADAAVSVNVDIKAGFVIDLSEPRVVTARSNINGLDGNGVHGA